jgi:hypothetical protein
MMKCKWAGDPNDEYCKNCDGVTMDVDGNSISCSECAGYEAGTEEVDSTPDMNEPIPDKVKESLPIEEAKNAKSENNEKPSKNNKSNNNTPKEEKPLKSKNNKATKVKEEKKAVEKTAKDENGQVKVVSMRYTSGATIKRNDNYFKFIAEEEWDVSQVDNVEDVRGQLWAKLNGEVDKQIEELQNL